MTDNRPVCASCNESMKCEKNGVVVKYGVDERQNGDLYKCPICDVQVIIDFGEKYYAPKSKYDYVRGE